MIRERAYNGIPGLPVLLVLLFADAALVWMLVMNIREENGPEIVFAAVMIALVTFLCAGLFMVNPNEGKVLQLFGEYKGTAKLHGLRWANPFLTKKKVSLRVRNFESSHLKVNDIDGNPIEIAAVVVWKVFETAEAIFEVDDYEHYVKVQSEAALRNLATSYAYDAHDDAQVSLRGHTSANQMPHAIAIRPGMANAARHPIHLMRNPVTIAAAAIPRLPARPFTPITAPGFRAFWTSIGMPTGW